MKKVVLGLVLVLGLTQCNVSSNNGVYLNNDNPLIKKIEITNDKATFNYFILGEMGASVEEDKNKLYLNTNSEIGIMIFEKKGDTLIGKNLVNKGFYIKNK